MRKSKWTRNFGKRRDELVVEKRHKRERGGNARGVILDGG